ncbi:MAG: hypothetical protein ACRD2U_13755 [Terriglobales bacterium]
MDSIPSRKTVTRAITLLGILLVAISGFAQAVHVHPDNSKLPSHECSICSVAHCGVIGTPVYQPVPVVVSSTLCVAPDIILRSTSFVLSLRIRPPPSV